MNSREIVVYTCVTKGYDSLRPVDTNAKNIKYVCFTNCPKQISKGWLTYPLQSPSRLKNGHDINRFHKIFPHLLFPTHRYSIYMDGNIEYRGDYKKLIEAFKKSNYAFGAFRHPYMLNLISEANTCQKVKKFDEYDLRRYEEQIQSYMKSGFNVSEVITANYLLVRDHYHPLIHSSMSLWWSHLFEYTKRDQMSLNYVLWKENVPFVFLDNVEGVDPINLVRHSHRTTFFNKVRFRFYKLIRKIGYHLNP